MDENVVNSTPVETSAPEPSYDSPATETTDSGNSYDSGESGNSEPSVVASAETDDGGMSLVKDPITGQISLKFGSDEEQQTEQPQEENQPQEDDNGERGTDNVDAGQTTTQAPMYNLDEFSTALANGYVDPSRVPQEYQAQYADYRIREALQQRQAQQQAAYQREMAQRQQLEQQMKPENRTQVNKDFYNALEEEATKAALQDLGMTQEELEEAEFADNAEEIQKNYQNAKDWHKQRIRGELEARYRQEQNYRIQQQNTYARIQQYVAAERAKEPNFDAIDKTLATRYQTMPLNQGRVIESALTALKNGTIDDRGMQIIDKYYQDCRKEWYANKNGLKASGKPQQAPRKAPPVVENAGQGQTVNREYKPNYKSLRNATVDQKHAWVREYFKNNGW